MINGQMPFEILALIGLTIAAMMTAVWSALVSKPTKVQARLEAIKKVNETVEPVSVITDDAPKRFWERLLISLGRNQATARRPADSLRIALRHAGFRRQSAIQIVLGLRLLLTIGIPLLAAPVLLARGVGHMPLVCLLLATSLALGYLLPPTIVGKLALRRKRRINIALPDVLDLLVLCVESGLALTAAIARVAEDRARTKDPLGEELAQLASELRVGIPRRDALRNLAERTGSDDIRALVAHLVQTERLGGNLGPALRAQSDSVRAMRRLRAEEIANRMPVKMLLPTVMFMPALFIVIFVPVALHAIGVLRGG